MTTIALLVFGLTMLGGIVPSGHAQSPPGRAAGGGGYDPSTVETVRGEVVGVEHIAAAKGRSGGVHLMLKTDRETVPVHLGPAWYVDKQNVHVERGDRVEVTGSRVSFAGKPAIIARQVTKGGKTLTLRNEAGVPAWAGRGGGPHRGGGAANR